jgi:hypothetical protein
MRLSDTLSMATTALVGNPVRTLLTLLGILIGVGCVVSMAAIGAGAQAQWPIRFARSGRTCPCSPRDQRKRR